MGGSLQDQSPVYFELTGFAKQVLRLNVSDFAILMNHNSICDEAITLKFPPT